MMKKMQETSAQESREWFLRPGGAVPDLPSASFQEMLRQMQTRNSGEAAPPVGYGPRYGNRWRHRTTMA